MPPLGAKKRKRVTNGAKRPYKVMRYKGPTRAIMRPALSTRLQFPSVTSHRTTLRYFGNFIAVNPGAAGIADTHVFSANGLYDPDITGTGHQPIGFDQLMVIYDHYTVIGSKIKVYGEDSDTSHACWLYCAVRDGPTASTDTREIVENGYTSLSIMKRLGAAGYHASVMQNVDVAKFLGRSSALSDSQLKGDVTANPAEQVYYHVGAFAFNQVDASSVNLNVIIEYDVIFHERKVLGPS